MVCVSLRYGVQIGACHADDESMCDFCKDPLGAGGVYGPDGNGGKGKDILDMDVPELAQGYLRKAAKCPSILWYKKSTSSEMFKQYQS